MKLTNYIFEYDLYFVLLPRFLLIDCLFQTVCSLNSNKNLLDLLKFQKLTDQFFLLSFEQINKKF